MTKLLETFQSLPDAERSDRLINRVEQTIEDLDGQLERLDSDLDTFDKEISLSDSAVTNTRYEQFCESMEELRSVIAEYRAVLGNFSTVRKSDTFVGSLVDLKLLTDDLKSGLEAYSDVSKDLINQLYRDIADELEQVDAKSTSITQNTPDSCPICTGDTTVIEESFEQGDLSYSLLRCTQCDTEWSISVESLTVTSGPEELEGVSMPTAVWERGADKGYSLPEELNEFERLAEMYEREKRRLIIAVVLGELAVLISSYLLGSLALGIVGTFLLTVGVWGIFSWRVDRVLGDSPSVTSD